MEITPLLEYPIGSFLYGTNTENSDKDYAGVFVAEIDYYFGLKNIKEADMSIKSKDAYNKNTSEAIDKKFYELKRFINLAKDNNPTIIEQLFIPRDKLIYHNTNGLKLLEHKKDFLHKGLYYRFLGYAYSQKKKMIIKLDNYKDYEYVRDVIQNADPRDTLFHIRDKIKKFIFKDEHIKVGDIKIPMGILNKKALDILNKRFKNLSNRTILIKKYGYDTKFASHLIRLVLEGIELLKTKNLIFPLQQANYIKDIKKGKYGLDDVLNDFDKLEKQIKNVCENSDLPKYPDFNKLNKLSIDLIYHQLKINQVI